MEVTKNKYLCIYAVSQLFLDLNVESTTQQEEEKSKLKHLQPMFLPLIYMQKSGMQNNTCQSVFVLNFVRC